MKRFGFAVAFSSGALVALTLASGSAIACEVQDITVNVLPCNDQGTSDPTDDTFIVDFTIWFANRPDTGDLELLVDGQTFSTSVAGMASSGTFQFLSIPLPADGLPVQATARFTADATCTLTATVGTAPDPCSVACEVEDITTHTLPCNDQDSPDPTDDTFIVDFTIWFANRPDTGNLELVVDGQTFSTSVAGMASSGTFQFLSIPLPADGLPVQATARFTADATCTLTATVGTAPDPCSCDVVCAGPEPPCEAGQDCDPSTRTCIDLPDAPLGTVCDADGSLCTGDQCDGSGTCMNVSGVICPPGASSCDGGQVCNPATGMCEDEPDAPAGTPCSDVPDTEDCADPGCDGAGACLPAQNPEPDGIACPDTDGNVCSTAACETGMCVQNFACATEAPACRITLGDFVWDDMDGDGIQDGHEPGIENVLVHLVEGCTAPEDGGGIIASTATAADGSYGFSVVGIDEVTCAPITRDLLVEVDASNLKAGGVLEGLTGSPRFVGADPTVDSNCNVDTFRTMCMAYSPGADQTIDCGFFVPFPICVAPREPLPLGLCQLPDGENAYTSDLKTPYRGAEHFAPTADFEITVLRWWGLYYDFTAGEDCSPGPGDAFQVTYYLDAGGAPSAVHAGPFPIAAADLQKCHTGELVVPGVGVREWQYEAPVPAVHFEAGVSYWVEIANDTTGSDCTWLWSTAPPGDDMAFQTGDGPITDDLAFCFNTIRRTCRTAGYYSTHSNDAKAGARNVTQDLLDAAGCLEVCDEVVHTTAVNDADSAVEGLCVAVQGTPERQLARQLIALGLNCIASGYGPACEGWEGVEQLFRDCNMECDAPAPLSGISVDECIEMVSCVNEGGDPFGAAGVCFTGTCSDNGQPCSARDRSNCANPVLATCDDDLASCHARDLCNPGVGVCVEPGTSADPSNCKRAKASACTILEVGRTTEEDCAYGIQEPEEECLLLDGAAFSPVTEDLMPCATARDAWEFAVHAGETVVVAADTVDGATAADLRLSVLCDTGDAVLGDDEQACSYPPPAFDCPRETFVASGNARCRVTVDVFDAVCTDATTAHYELTVPREGAPAALLLTADDA